MVNNIDLASTIEAALDTARPISFSHRKTVRSKNVTVRKYQCVEIPELWYLIRAERTKLGWGSGKLGWFTGKSGEFDYVRDLIDSLQGKQIERIAS